jgi:hypothetical protein
MYGMNLTTWRHDPYVAERHAPETIDRLAADLTALASGPRTSELTWGIRQAVFERAL